MNPIAVQTHSLFKSFGTTPAIESLDLTVYNGEILALVGPSGCGKTTLLRLLAGFEQPDSGRIEIHGQVVTDRNIFLPPELRGIGMVFQDYALFPHLSVSENVAFGLRDLKVSQRAVEAHSWLERVGLAGYGKRYPHELSGGERQRVALARALAQQPVLVLMDEPFSNLDADRRAQMRDEVGELLRQLKATVLFVTHDQEEALIMGDRMAVLNQGRLEQVDTPEAVFQHPRTRFVAEFLGQTDFLPGVVTTYGIQTEAGLVRQQVELPAGERVELAVRSDDVAISADGGIPVRVLARHYKGIYTVYRLQLPSGQVLHSLQPHTCVFSPGATACLQIQPGHDLTCFCGGDRVN